MSVIGHNVLLGASGNQGGYQVSRSLRFRSSASAYLNRTPAAASNRKTWTWSGWIKRGSLSSVQNIFIAGSNVAGQLSTQISFDSTDIIYVYSTTAGSAADISLNTTQVFRDPSSWYHLIVAVDTTQATASNRVKIYINGSQVTAFSTATYPSLNYDTAINNNVSHTIARFSNVAANYYDGYLAEVNFIDGQALTPSSFGAYDTNGVWQPKKYSGTYGTNGFYLNFSDNSAATAAAIGKDSSGNGNNWTPNNISLTAGTTYDSMIDSPTSFSDGSTYYNRGNYATLNPINQSSYVTLSNANLTVTGNTSANSGVALSTIGMLSGKWYWETTITTVGGFSYAGMGISPPQNNAETYFTNSAATGGCGWRNDGSGGGYGSTGATYSTFTTNDIIGVAVDFDNGALYFSKNGTWINGGVPTSGASRTGATNTWTVGAITGFPAGAGYNSSVNNLNLGQRPFSYTPPTGYKALNTFNLPTPTIPNGAAYMAATLYTGNGSTQSISNGTNNTLGITFQPDLVWVKTRVVASSNALFDSVRGVTKVLVSNSANAEANLSPNGVSAFNSGGFSVTDDSAGNYYVNGASGGTYSGTPPNYVAWNWKAGAGTTSTNTSGSITSTVSANTTAGFSIVTYTGNGTISATVGHGLGVAPSMYIVKMRSAAGGSWQTYHTSIGPTGTVYLDLTSATSTNIGFWNNTAPTSTVISIGNSGSANVSGQTFVAYCFAAVRGYSAFGSYTGNGSSDGPFIYTGFRPLWVMIKRTDTAGNYWCVVDSSRETYNSSNNSPVLYPNSSLAESTSNTFSLDLLSNGFKVRNISSDVNASGGTYIYAAFAENPFNYSRAR